MSRETALRYYWEMQRICCVLGTVFGVGCSTQHVQGSDDDQRRVIVGPIVGADDTLAPFRQDGAQWIATSEAVEVRRDNRAFHLIPTGAAGGIVLTSSVGATDGTVDAT